MKIFIKALT